ncbi:MAG: type 1 fimbrial protein [Hafnia sp.]
MKKIVCAVAMASVMVTGAVNAASNVDQGHGKIKFEGSVIEAACSIDSKSIDQTVQLGSIASHALKSGGKSTPVDFSIKLHDCDTSVGSGSATVAFNGIAGESASGLDKAFATTGQAGGGVGVTITDLGGVIIAPNSSSTAMTLADGDNELAFQAYVMGSNATGGVIPGTFNSVANFVMDYN